MRNDLGSVAALADSTGGKRRSCDGCGRVGHDEANCWEKHPEKMPAHIKERRAKASVKAITSGEDTKRQRFKWVKIKAGDAVSMLSEESDNSVLALSDAPENVIFVDSCAENILFLLCDRSPMENYRKSRKSLGTASTEGRLMITGTGLVGEVEAKHCPNLRHPIISVGQLFELNHHMSTIKKGDLPAICRDSDGERV